MVFLVFTFSLRSSFSTQVYINLVMSTKIIRLTNQNDILLAKVAKMAKISGATLPSGLQVPKATEDEDWVFFGNSIILVYKSTNFSL